jgi:hypothetical protein
VRAFPDQAGRDAWPARRTKGFHARWTSQTTPLHQATAQQGFLHPAIYFGGFFHLVAELNTASNHLGFRRLMTKEMWIKQASNEVLSSSCGW